MLPLPTSSAGMRLVSPGSPSRVGTSWPITSAQYSRNWNVSWRSGCVQASTLSTAATSRCCPIRTSSSMSSVNPLTRCRDRPRKPEGASRPTPTRKIRGTQGFGLDSRLGSPAGLMGVLLFDRFALGPTVGSTLGGFAYHFWNVACFGIHLRAWAFQSASLVGRPLSSGWGSVSS
jgi:hypothetical protein